MPRAKINRETIEHIVRECGYKLLTDGELQRKSRVKVRCEKHDYIWETSYENLKYEKGRCRLCATNSVDVKTLNDFINAKNGELIKRIVNKGVQLTVRCKAHNYIWKTNWNKLFNGNNWCKKCDNDNKRIKHEQVKKLVESKDGVLLTENCSANNRFRVKCNKDGHEWETNWYRVSAGNWCQKCNDIKERAKLAARMLAEAKVLAEKKGGEALDTVVVNNKTFIIVKCNVHNKTWRMSLGALQKGQWCKDCFFDRNNRKMSAKDILDLNNLLKEKSFELLSPVPAKYYGEITLYCLKHNITWKTTPAHILKGNSNCKLCGHGTVDFAEINKILAENNVTLVKRLVGAGTIRNILLRCNKHNHEWKTNASAILIKDRWCIHCAREKRKTSYEKIKAKVEKCGGILLTENCSGSKSRITIRCKEGHEWETTFDAINKSWCPQCNWVEQGKLYEIIKGIYNCEVKYNFRGFDWLKVNQNSSHKMEIDIWVPDLKLAIEYDGIQHFQPTKFTSKITDEQALEDFKQLQSRDQKKNELIKQSDEIKYFVRFDYRQNINKKNVIKELKKNKVPVKL